MVDTRKELEVRRQVLNKVVSQCSGNLLNDEVIKLSKLVDELIWVEQNKLEEEHG